MSCHKHRPHQTDRCRLWCSCCAASNTATRLNAARKSIKIQKSADAFNNVGIAFQHNQQMEQAIRAYRAGLKLDPKNAILLANLGKLVFNAGRHEDGIALLEKSKITTFYPRTTKTLYFVSPDQQNIPNPRDPPAKF